MTRGLLACSMAFLPGTEVVSGVSACREAWVLHGIFGSGRNWWSFARAATQRWPEWRFVLVDLRHHGRSPGAPPPDTLDAVAADLERLAEARGRGPELLIGHSFGGKVALALLARGNLVAREIWLMDSNPGLGPPPGPSRETAPAARTLSALASTPQPLASRGLAAGELMARGVEEAVARWLATSLQRVEGGFAFPFPLPRLRELLDSYWDLDGWRALRGAAGRARVHLVMGEHSPHFPGPVRAEVANAVAEQILISHELAGAGHWVQADAPEGLLAMLEPALAAVI